MWPLEQLYRPTAAETRTDGGVDGSTRGRRLGDARSGDSGRGDTGQKDSPRETQVGGDAAGETRTGRGTD